ncbi:MAG TPA: alpha-2-macroglobulin, partial [Gemmata sp.]|nr:alpha-2-macroglobulin [Gemmata sp.]
MTPESPIIAELKPLLDALCEESISPDQMKRLEELVLNHPEAEAHYIQFMSFYADLIGQMGGLPQRPKITLNRLATPEARPIEPNIASKPSPQVKEKSMPRSRIRWELAAAVLFVVCGLGTLGAFQFSGWYRTSRDAEARKQELDDARTNLARLQEEQKAAQAAARKEMDAATAAHQKTIQDFQAALTAARKAIADKDFQVRLTGPAHIQPGAPNKWQIETLRHGAIGRPKKMDVIVKDAKDTELFRQTHDNPVGAATLELPIGFWEKVKPGSDLFLEVVAYTDDNRKSVIAERLPLARPVYVTHLATDKPLYKPGEVIHFRSLTLDRATLLPPALDMHLRFRLRDPAGAIVPLAEGNIRLLSADFQQLRGPDQKPLRGIGVGEHALSPDAAGGEYALELVDVNASNQEVLLETRKFIVNRYVPDVFEKKLEFDGKSYGAGDTVQARIEVSRTAGGPMKNATANLVATLDGKPIFEEKGQKFTIGADGKAILNVRFKLPTTIFDNLKPDAAPNATLSASIQDGSDAEAIVRPVPLVTKTLLVDFYPEGGDMIEGLAGRVYFQVRTPNGKPADLKGVITDGTNKIAEVATLTDADNEGVNRGHG